MAIITQTSELKAFVAVTTTLEPEDFAPSIASAERDYLLPALGQSLLTSLTSAYQDSLGSNPPTFPPALLALLPLAQAVVANLGFYNYVNSIGTVQVTGSGITSSVGKDQKTAFQWQIDDVKKAYQQEGFKCIDALLAFLEANVSNYSTWKSSPQYTLYKDTLLYTTPQVEFIYPLYSSRLVFLLLKPSIRHIEETTITDLLGSTLYDALLLKLVDGTNYSALEGKVVKLCREATAWLALDLALPSMVAQFNALGINQQAIEAVTDNNRAVTPASQGIVRNQSNNASSRGLEALQRLRKLLVANATALAWTAPDAQSAINYNEGITGSGIVMF